MTLLRFRKFFTGLKSDKKNIIDLKIVTKMLLALTSINDKDSIKNSEIFYYL